MSDAPTKAPRTDHRSHLERRKFVLSRSPLMADCYAGEPSALKTLVFSGSRRVLAKKTGILPET